VCVWIVWTIFSFENFFLFRREQVNSIGSYILNREFEEAIYYELWMVSKMKNKITLFWKTKVGYHYEWWLQGAGALRLYLDKKKSILRGERANFKGKY